MYNYIDEKLRLVLRQYNVLCTQVWDLEIIMTCMGLIPTHSQYYECMPIGYFVHNTFSGTYMILK